MQWKQIIRAAFDLTDEEWDQAVKLRALSEPERELLMTALGPQKPAAKKSSTTARKIEHCAACDYTKRAAVHKDASVDGYHEFQSSKSAPKKSAHAKSLGDAIQRRPRGVVVTGDDADSDKQRCTVLRGDLGGTVCSLLADHNVHHLESVRGFHPFVSPASSAPPPSDQASSEIGKGAAGDAHRAAGSGD